MFIDSHCHFDFSCFTTHREQLLQQLKHLQISHLIIPATQKKTWANIQQLCAEHQHLYYALGIHPYFLDTFIDKDLLTLQTLLENRDGRCVAVGEIGLDKYADADLQLQEKVFTKQLQIAERAGLPVILHIVKQQSQVLQILKKSKFSQGGVYHAFSGSDEIALEFIKLGFKLGIGGVITHPDAKKTRQTVSRLPIEALLLETDAPDMPVYKQPLAYNSPTNLPTIFDALLSIRKESKNCLSKEIYKNTLDIFSINDD